MGPACSSSLVALHQARAFLGSGGELALAAGVNILVGPHEFVGFSKASMLSPTGRCRAFSAAADGFVRAEGGVVLVLKPLDRALADGDRVHAVLVVTGTNSDGRTPGLAQPSAQAQAALLRQVYGPAGPDPRELVYMEAHGTGTPVGDPLECEAVSAALAARRTAGLPLPIGSVKTNLGHLESASGLAGLLKAVLVLRHRVVPPSLHGRPVNPAVDFPRLGLAPVPTATPLATASGGIVGVNSFGFGGSNAHAVLAPAPAARPDPPEGPLPVLVSARTPAALAEAATALADRLDAVGADAHTFYDIAHTTLMRRGRHPLPRRRPRPRRPHRRRPAARRCGRRARTGARERRDRLRLQRQRCPMDGNGTPVAGRVRFRAPVRADRVPGCRRRGRRGVVTPARLVRARRARPRHRRDPAGPDGDRPAAAVHRAGRAHRRLGGVRGTPGRRGRAQRR